MTRRKQKIKTIPWQQIYGLRNRIVHGYSGVSMQIVWDTVHNDIPMLHDEIADFLARGSLAAERYGRSLTGPTLSPSAHMRSPVAATVMCSTLETALMLDACNAICADPVGNASYRVERSEGTQFFRYVEGLGAIAYTQESV